MKNYIGGTFALQHYYTLDSIVWRGSVGAVFRGTQDPFSKPVLIEVLGQIQSIGNREEFVSRIREASQQGSRLRDEVNLRVLDFGMIDDETPFIVREYFDGLNLSDWVLEESPLSVYEVVDFAEQIARSVSDAQKMGLVGTSLWRDRVLLKREAGKLAVRMFGFGMNITHEEVNRLEGGILRRDLVTGFSPEEFDGEQKKQVGNSEAKLVYSLGCLCYEALTGVHPFFDEISETSEAILSTLQEPVTPLNEFVNIFDDVDFIIRKALAKEPRDRPVSMLAFVNELKKALGTGEPVSKKVKKSKKAKKLKKKKEIAELTFTDDAPEKISRRRADSIVEELFHRHRSPLPFIIIIGVLVVLLVTFFLSNYNKNSSTDKINEDPVAAIKDSEETGDLSIIVTSTPSNANVFLVGKWGANIFLGSTPLIVKSRMGAIVKLTIAKKGYKTKQVTEAYLKPDPDVDFGRIEAILVR